MNTLFLWKVLIGSTPKGRNTEQHDVFFGIASSIKDLVPQLKNFWPEAAETMHVDAFKMVTNCDGYKILIKSKEEKSIQHEKLFFINLGGYKPQEFDEYHYRMLIVATNKGEAIKKAKETVFYKHTGFKGAPSHIDDKYGIDVDDIYAIEDVLPQETKNKFSIHIKKIISNNLIEEDKLNLGYYILSKLERGIIETD